MLRFPDVAVGFYALIHRTGLLKIPLFEHLYYQSYYLYKRFGEDPFAALVQHRPDLFAGGHILDVGANIGYTAGLFASAVTGDSVVFAFEPEENNFAQLKRSLANRALDARVRAVRAAVGDVNGRGDLWLNPGHPADHRIVTERFQGLPGSSGRVQNVRVIRLDDFCREEIPGEPVRFIKIDVQGYEGCVCRGMSDILQNNPDATVVVEYYPQGIKQLGFRPDDVLDFFAERGFGAYFISKHGTLVKTHNDSILAAVGSDGYRDILFSKSDKILDGKAHERLR